MESNLGTQSARSTCNIPSSHVPVVYKYLSLAPFYPPPSLKSHNFVFQKRGDPSACAVRCSPPKTRSRVSMSALLQNHHRNNACSGEDEDFTPYTLQSFPNLRHLALWSPRRHMEIFQNLSNFYTFSTVHRSIIKIERRDEMVRSVSKSTRISDHVRSSALLPKFLKLLAISRVPSRRSKSVFGKVPESAVTATKTDKIFPHVVRRCG